MNPIVYVERLVNNHASSTILKKRLGFLGDQVSALENKNRSLNLNNTILKNKEKTIESQLNKARKEIERWNQFVQELEKNDAKTRLDAVTEKVLKMFFYRRRELSVSEVADTLSIDVTTIRYHSNFLLENKLIRKTKLGFVSISGRKRDSRFIITSSGREYVFGKILR